MINDPDPGTRERAEMLTEGRHPGVRDALQWLTYSHLPLALQTYSQPFYDAAVILLVTIGTDSPELTTALNKLIEAKDSAVRAGIKDSTGRAGSVPRPATVVDPPKFGEDADKLEEIRRLLVGQRGSGNLTTLQAIQSVVWPDDPPVTTVDFPTRPIKDWPQG